MRKARSGSWHCRCNSRTYRAELRRSLGSFTGLRRSGLHAATAGSWVDEFVPSITLRIQQRSEVSVVDPRMCLRGDTRLRPVGDAEPSRLQHGKIIGPIADRQRGVALQPELSRNFEQRCELRVPSEDRLFHAFEAAISAEEAVGAIFVEAGPWRH